MKISRKILQESKIVKFLTRKINLPFVHFFQDRNIFQELLSLLLKKWKRNENT